MDLTARNLNGGNPSKRSNDNKILVALTLFVRSLIKKKKKKKKKKQLNLGQKLHKIAFSFQRKCVISLSLYDRIKN